MKKRIFAIFCAVTIVGTMLAGCGSSSSSNQEAVEASTEAVKTTSSEVPEDGVYEVAVSTDSSMFHLNDSCDGKGTLTVADGQMTVHITLTSKKIINLFEGSSADAQKDGANLLQPTVDEVTYDDGYKEEAYGFDLPVPALDEPFAVAILGSKGKWYDHTVTVSSPE